MVRQIRIRVWHNIGLTGTFEISPNLTNFYNNNNKRDFT